jgi:hypothetical protein
MTTTLIKDLKQEKIVLQDRSYPQFAWSKTKQGWTFKREYLVLPISKLSEKKLFWRKEYARNLLGQKDL